MRKLSVVVAVLCATSAAQQTPKLDTTTFVVIGEGLAAGLADFALREVYQQSSFPALMARQMETAFPQPLIQAPGIGGVAGFDELPIGAPGPRQTTVRSLFPPTLFVFNLAVPGHRLSDALHLRPTAPLLQDNPKQTLVNLLLGYPALILGTDLPLWSQVEYAVRMNPTLALVELGYAEALEAAVNGDPNLIPEPAAFRSDYAKVLGALRETQAQVIATTIPDPLDTAYFSTVPAAVALTGVTIDQLAARYRLEHTDLLTPNALAAIGTHAAELPPGSLLSAATAAGIRQRVRALNSEISGAAQQSGAITYDLNGLFARVRSGGVTAGTLRLTADYLGGFYSLSGSYPGSTGHALIANEILSLLNQTFRTSFPLLDLTKTAAADPAVRFRATTFGGVR